MSSRQQTAFGACDGEPQPYSRESDVVTFSIVFSATNLLKQAPIWQPSPNGNRKRDTAAVGRTFLRSPPLAPPQLLFGSLR